MKSCNASSQLALCIGCTPQQQVFNLTNDNIVSVSSPNFGTGDYPENSLCVWQVTVSA